MIFKLIVLILCFTSSLQADIRPANSMRYVAEFFEDTDSETLAIFDIDMVLLQPDHPAFQMANIERYKHIVKELLQPLSCDQISLFFTLVQTSYRPLLIDWRTPFFIEQLRRAGVPTIALTAALSNSFGPIADLAFWRRSWLNAYGIDFEKAAPEIAEHIFSKLPSFRNCYPSYKKGILLTNGERCSKGILLVAFLKATELHPKQIIFIDDRMENLCSVEQALLEYDSTITYHGIHFLGALHSPTVPISEEEFRKSWQQMLSHLSHFS